MFSSTAPRPAEVELTIGWFFGQTSNRDVVIFADGPCSIADGKKVSIEGIPATNLSSEAVSRSPVFGIQWVLIGFAWKLGRH
jgi:hypothetical protein